MLPARLVAVKEHMSPRGGYLRGLMCSRMTSKKQLVRPVQSYLSCPYRRSGWTIRKESLKYGLPHGSLAVLDFAHWLETASR